MQIRRLQSFTDSDIHDLCTVLIDCVEGGASVSFMHPLDYQKAFQFWNNIKVQVQLNKRIVLVAYDDESICGTVQLITDQPENQPFRAEIAKMLVHRRVRKKGIGTALLKAIEEEARKEGKTLLVLDTVTGSDAAKLYEKSGWIKVGSILGYALFPDGTECSTTIYYRRLQNQDKID